MRNERMEWKLLTEKCIGDFVEEWKIIWSFDWIVFSRLEGTQCGKRKFLVEEGGIVRVLREGRVGKTNRRKWRRMWLPHRGWKRLAFRWFRIKMLSGSIISVYLIGEQRRIRGIGKPCIEGVIVWGRISGRHRMLVACRKIKWGIIGDWPRGRIRGDLVGWVKIGSLLQILWKDCRKCG